MIAKDTPSTSEPAAQRLENIRKRFEQLFRREIEAIRNGDPGDEISSGKPSRDCFSTVVKVGRGEPFVDFVSDDYVSLCSSGGGIRSATFNLGVLQGLAKLGLPRMVDYHSTVSGGGYVGGWWTAWRQEHGDLGVRSSTPVLADKEKPWQQSGLVPFTETTSINSESNETVSTEAGSAERYEESIPARNKSSSATNSKYVESRGDEDSLFPRSIANGPLEPDAVHRLRQQSRFLSPTGFGVNAVAWQGLTLWALGMVGTLSVSLSLIGIVLLLNALLVWVLGSQWLLAGILLLIGLTIHTAMTLFGSPDPTLRRSFIGSGLFASGLVVIGIGGLITLANTLQTHSLSSLAVSIGSTGTGAVAVRLLTGWVNRRSRSKSPGGLGIAASWIVPPLISGLVIAAMAFTLILVSKDVSQFLMDRLPDRFDIASTDPVCLLAIVLGLILVSFIWGLWSIPSTLHRFYRDRIRDAFLTVPTENGETSTMQNWSSVRPLHVVNCCGATGAETNLRQIDRLGVSAAFSAAGSRFDVSADRPVTITPETAITASAAAANPTMGLFSARLGKLVGFVLFTFNVRLGTWCQVPATDSGSDRRSSGFWNLLAECFGRYSLPVFESGGAMHLSDGGHFENLAAYEMIRRRCRYIIICDAGADPDATFGELANLQTLVREDFGVEIEIDLEPLRLSGGPPQRSKKHLVVGTIRYPRNPKNKNGFTEDGILVYIKPSMTGDEPEDITKYQVRQPSFPHEMTADQFFDSHQWEAYRKLGEHSVEKELKHLHSYLTDGDVPPARIFDAINRQHRSGNFEVPDHPTLRSRVIDPAKPKKHGWIDEVIHEIASANPKNKAALRSSAHRVLQSLEELQAAFVKRSLLQHGDHLDNWGWENWADRLVSTPEVRAWWPVMVPLFRIPFRSEYLSGRYGLGQLVPVVDPSLVAFRCHRANEIESIRGTRRRVFERLGSSCVDRIGREVQDWPGDVLVLEACYRFHLPSVADHEIVMGAMALRLNDHDTPTIEMTNDDLQVAPGYWSVGINKLLADELLRMTKLDDALPQTSRASAAQTNMSEDLQFQLRNVSGLTLWKDCRHRTMSSNDPNGDSMCDRLVIIERPETRHFWVQRGFRQTVDGRLVISR